jgi:Zn-dependent M28 family amino/carboxypeptidase
MEHAPTANDSPFVAERAKCNGVRSPLFVAGALFLIGTGALGAWAMQQRRTDPRGAESPIARAATLEPAPIDGERAYAYLKQICDIGPRPAGSEANSRQRKLVADHFQAMGATVREQRFAARDPLSGQRVTMVNLIGSWFPDRGERVVIGAHYDTRPHPDLELTAKGRAQPFIGANDGASGVALLMEIAHHLKSSPTPWGIDLVLFDGEELVYDRTGELFLGSAEFARQYRNARRTGKSRDTYVCGIVLDMVGDRDLRIPREPYSQRFAGRLQQELWAVARKLGVVAFVDEMGPEVRDDHLSLNAEGIPTVDIIDFEYPDWHLASDLPDKCAPQSLEAVGRVVTAWLALPKPRPRR